MRRDRTCYVASTKQSATVGQTICPLLSPVQPLNTAVFFLAAYNNLHRPSLDPNLSCDTPAIYSRFGRRPTSRTHHGERDPCRRRRYDRPISTRTVVLRDARVYAMVDDGCAKCESAGAVPHGVALFAVLQLQDGFCQKPGASPQMYFVYNCMLTLCAVLAPHNYVLLLWAIQSGPSLPHILPSAVLTSPRGVVRAVASTLCMASYIRFDITTLYGPAVFNGVSRLRPVKHAGLYLESKEPRYHAQLLGPFRIQSAILAMGVDVLRPCHAWNRTER